MILFLFGEDNWRKRQKLVAITEKFVREADPSRMNLTTFGASDLDEETMRAKLLAAPFLARKRMVVVRNLLSESRRKGLVETFLGALKDVGEHTALVVTEDSAKPKTWKNQDTKAAWEYLEKKATAEEFRLLTGVKLEATIVAQAKELGLTLQKDAAALLAMMCGGDLGWADKELQKLGGYLAAEPRVEKTAADRPRPIPTVTVDHIKLLCTTVEGEANIFDFLDALGTQDKKNLMRTFEEQLEEADPLSLVSRITGHLRALLAITLKGEAGGQALRLHPFQLRKMQSQIRQWDAPALKTLLFKFLALDYATKRGLAADTATQLTALLARIG